MSKLSTAVGRHRAPESPGALETIASLADVDRPGRHTAPEGDSPIYDALRDELAAVDWFSLGRD
ncbi:hypothetical protein [Candidatus Blastococcus massiliensis]|uniref:hypothetical protein n=1 Tax=Candidatus Blastococcus massiliensis TaxID=1470358 RepID=UPI0004BB8AAE|nr:hypothetical protein [Candidatus Blastococcus massiliensis]